MQQKRKRTLQISLIAVFTAMTTIVTMFVQVPNVITEGYVNIGDSMVLLASTILGPIPGMLIGGFGSALADILSGYMHWALPTLVIKGIEGFLCGILTHYIFLKCKSRVIKLTFTAIASLFSAIVMMIGYFLANLIMGGAGKAIASLIPNTIQAVASFGISMLLVSAFIKSKIFDGMLSTGITHTSKQSHTIEPPKLN